MSVARRTLVPLALIVGLAAQAGAHQTSLSHVGVTQDGNGARARIKMTFLDLEVAVGVDGDFDGKITWGETKASLERISTYAMSRTRLTAGGACTLERQSATPSFENGESYLTLEYAVACPDADAAIAVASTLFLDIDPTSRVLVTTRTGAGTRTLVLGPADQPPPDQ